jgi:hypothetical protein
MTKNKNNINIIYEFILNIWVIISRHFLSLNNKILYSHMSTLHKFIKYIILLLALR